MPNDPPPLRCGYLAIQRLDPPVDLRHATILHRLTVIADPRDARRPLGGERLAADAKVGEKVYGAPDPEDAFEDRKIYQAKSIRLGALIQRGVREFIYVYDFGDNWRRGITVLDLRQGDAGVDYPHFVAGARRAPPEDVGSISGIEKFLEAMADPEHEEHERMVWESLRSR